MRKYYQDLQFTLFPSATVTVKHVPFSISTADLDKIELNKLGGVKDLLI